MSCAVLCQPTTPLQPKNSDATTQAPTLEMVSGVSRSPADSSAPAGKQTGVGNVESLGSGQKASLDSLGFRPRTRVTPVASSWPKPVQSTSTTAPRRTAQHSAAQHSTAQHSAAQRTMQGGEVGLLDGWLRCARSGRQVCMGLGGNQNVLRS